MSHPLAYSNDQRGNILRYVPKHESVCIWLSQPRSFLQMVPVRLIFFPPHILKFVLICNEAVKPCQKKIEPICSSEGRGKQELMFYICTVQAKPQSRQIKGAMKRWGWHWFFLNFAQRQWTLIATTASFVFAFFVFLFINVKDWWLFRSTKINSSHR